MSQLLKVYIEKDALEDIILLDDEYPNLNKIFGSGNCVFYINTSQDELNADIENEESDIVRFAIGHDFSINRYNSEQSTFQDVYKYGIIDVRDGRVMYIVKKESSETEKLQKMYGVIIQSSDSINDNIFDFGYSKTYHKGQELPMYENGWSEVLSHVQFPPMNTIVITDDHLLDNEKNGENVGEINMVNFLNAIIPHDLIKPCHVTILSNAPKNRSKKVAQRIINAVSKSRRNKIYINIAYCNTIHKRRIISNYFVIACDWGFKLFYPSKGKQNIIFNENEIEVASVFNDMKFRGDVYLNKSYSDLVELKDILIELREQSEGKVKDPSKILIQSEEKIPENILFSEL